MTKSKKIVQVIVYWLIHLVWGFPTFIIGSLVALFMLLSWNAPHRFGLCIYFTPKWLHGGGFSIGPYFFIPTSCDTSLSMKGHEHGHGIQTLWWGPLMLLVISIPSAVRFFYRDFIEQSKREQYKAGKITTEQYSTWLVSWPTYDSIWFERQATALGKKYFEV